MVVVSPLTANVCITHHETFSFKCYSIIIIVSSICEVSYFQQSPWEIGFA